MKKILPVLLILLAAAFAVPSGTISAQNRPVPTFPTNGFDMVGTTNNTFSWYYVTTNVYCTYILEIYFTPACTGTPVATRTVAGPNVFVNNVTGLLPGLNYYWRVRAVTANGPTAWSDVWRFSTLGTAPLHIFSTASQYGRISPSGTLLVTSGSSQTYTITPDPGCFIKDVLVDNTSIGVQTSYTFSNVTSIHRIEAVFDANTFTITASAGAHGTITPAGTTTAKYHTSVTYNFTPEAGYWVTGLTVDGVTIPPANSYTFSNIEADHSISVTFGQSYFITTKVTGQGTVTPAVSPVLVDKGNNQTLTFTPAAGYHVAEVKVDGIAVPGSASPAGATAYSFTNVQAHHTVDVTFSNTFPVTITAGTHGQVTPSGTSQMTAGSELSIGITPDNGYGIQSITVNGAARALAVPFVITVSQPLDILITFAATGKYYVSPGGDDANPGTAASQFKTIARAIAAASPGDSIIIADGIYNDFFMIDKPFLKIRGSAATFVPVILISTNNLYVKSLKINPALPIGGVPAGILNMPGTGYSDINLDNVTASGLPVTGLKLDKLTNVKITNSDFSNNTSGSFGMLFASCRNVTITDVTANNNALSGIYTFGASAPPIMVCSGFNLTRVTASGNGKGGPFPGFLLSDINNSTFKDLTAENNESGLIIAGADNLKLEGININRNTNYGVKITNSTALMYTIGGNVSSITFSGNNNIIDNGIFGLWIEGGITSALFGTTNINFTGKTVLKALPASAPPLLVIYGAVTSSSFTGLDITPNAGSGSAVNVGSLSQAIRPAGIKINSCVFRTTAGISLANALIGGIPSSENLDARSNAFTALTDTATIKFVMTDRRVNPAFGIIDYSGSTVGAKARIIVPNMMMTYTGATYFFDVNLEQKGTEYRYIKGQFMLGPNLTYKGFLSNGLMNNAKWTLVVTEPAPDFVEFEGFGPEPIGKDGKLFSLQIGIDNAGGNGATFIGGVGDFIGNTTTGEFDVPPAGILYMVPQGVVQDRGDVTLDKVVSMQDFYALLYHLGGTSVLTSPLALSNADFNSDGAVNQTDLNELYTFITGKTPAPAPASGRTMLAFNNTQIIPGGNAVIPVTLKNSADLKCIELTFTYDPALISFQAFSSLVKADGAVVHAYEVKPGTAKFNFQSASLLEGDINPGDIILHFKNSAVPAGSVIKTTLSLNGAEAVTGPVLTFKADGLTAVRTGKAANAIMGFDLAQNYPNPFNPVTTISYTVAERSYVTVRIYNMMGQEIRTLAMGEKEPGSYFVKWNGETDNGGRAASGTYIYRMTAGKFSASKKLIFMK